MNIRVEPGKYVVAVSGGVDSMVLLDVLLKQDDLELITAYYDHGIRTDSDDDRALVASVAALHGIPFLSEQGNLGAGASEALAREKRYAFLRRVQSDYSAQAIITAHHQDDVLETAIINMIRGTGRKGLSSLQESNDLKRPLLDISKQDILVYAKSHAIMWREDSTNSDPKYLRNYIRSAIMPKIPSYARAKLLTIISKAHHQNKEIDGVIEEMVAITSDSISRTLLLCSPFAVSCELLATWLRYHQLEFDKKSIERMVVSVKTLPIGKVIDVSGNTLLRTTKDELTIEQRPTTRKTHYISV